HAIDAGEGRRLGGGRAELREGGRERRVGLALLPVRRRQEREERARDLAVEVLREAVGPLLDARLHAGALGLRELADPAVLEDGDDAEEDEAACHEEAAPERGLRDLHAIAAARTRACSFGESSQRPRAPGRSSYIFCMGFFRGTAAAGGMPASATARLNVASSPSITPLSSPRT